MTFYTHPNKLFLTKISAKSIPGFAPVEVLPHGVASLAGLQPDVRREARHDLVSSLIIVYSKLCTGMDRNLQNPATK